MQSNFRTIYLYVVSLITLCMIISGIVSTVNNITSYLYPTSSVFYDDDTSSNYSYSYENTTDYNSIKNKQIQKDNYKKEKIKNAVVSIAVIVVGGILYKYHWNLIEKERTIE